MSCCTTRPSGPRCPWARAAALLAWPLLLALTGGCYSRQPLAPPGWRELPLAALAAAEPAAAAALGHGQALAHAPAALPAAASDASPAEPAGPGRLQVIICYGNLWSSHAALRLEVPGQEPLFWDPGGFLAEEWPGYRRQRDLIDEPPTLDEYWEYRIGHCREEWMEVYEFDAPAAWVGRLRAILLTGADPDAPQVTFDPDYPMALCCIAISEFLRRFAADRFDVPRKWLPHDFTPHLWRQGPDRVHQFRLDQPRTVILPPE